MSASPFLPRPPQESATISVVLPVFNEAQVLDALYQSITRSLRAHVGRVQMVFVNDGSTDGSDQIIDRLARRDGDVHAVHLSRNFGHQAAVQAGLEFATGDAVIVMDSDMQDDPQCLVEFVRKWQAGFDVVYAIRTHRKEGAIKRALFFGFYRILNLVSNTPMPKDAGNFGLIDRRVAASIRHLDERDRYYSGLRSWVGFRQTGVPVERLARHDGRPRVSFLGLCVLAKTALFSFSSVPMHLFYALGGLSFTVCVAFSLFTLYHKFATGLAIPGWTSTIMIASFFGALNSLGIAVLGEYVVRIYDQVRGRPTFLVARHVHAPPSAPAASDEDLSQITEDLAEFIFTLPLERSTAQSEPSGKAP